MDLETVSHFGIQNHRKSQNYYQSGSQETPQIHPKIDKNWDLGFSASSGCPPGPQDHQNGVPGTQKGASRSPKWQFFEAKVIHFRSHPVISCLLTGGRRQGRSLKIYSQMYLSKYLSSEPVDECGPAPPSCARLVNSDSEWEGVIIQEFAIAKTDTSARSLSKTQSCW